MSTRVGPDDHGRLDRLGLGAGERPGVADRIAADVPQAAAALGRVEADVAGAIEREAEAAADEPERADGPAGDQLLHRGASADGAGT